MSKTYYVSGPMRGIPKFNFPLFDSLSNWLRREGFGAINPADHDRDIDPACELAPGFATGDESLNPHPEMGFQNLLGWDLCMIASPECDGIVMLPGWEKSTGAAHERYVAEATGKEVWLAYPVYVNGFPADRGEWYMTLCEDRLLSSFTAEALRKAVSFRDGEPREAWAQDIEHVRQGSPFTHDPDRQEFSEKMASGITEFVSYDPKVPVFRQLGQYPSARRRESFALPDGMNEQKAVQIGQFQTKDSGARVEFASGMVRDVQDDKPRYDLIPLSPLKRLAELYARGAQKYGARNWQKANSQDELDRFKASGLRHFMQALSGERDEDHWAGAVFNIFAAMWLEETL